MAFRAGIVGHGPRFAGIGPVKLRSKSGPHRFMFRRECIETAFPRLPLRLMSVELRLHRCRDCIRTATSIIAISTQQSRAHRIRANLPATILDTLHRLAGVPTMRDFGIDRLVFTRTASQQDKRNPPAPTQSFGKTHGRKMTQFRTWQNKGVSRRRLQTSGCGKCRFATPAIFHRFSTQNNKKLQSSHLNFVFCGIPGSSRCRRCNRYCRRTSRTQEITGSAPNSVSRAEN